MGVSIVGGGGISEPEVQAIADAAEADANVYTDSAIDAVGGGLIYGPPMLVGTYYLPTNHNGTSTAVMPANERMIATPFLITRNLTLDRIGIEITAAGNASSVVRLGIYGTTGIDYKPGALVLDAGTVPGDGATGFKEITINQALTAGIYWLGAAPQAATSTIPTVRHLQQGWHGLVGYAAGGGAGSVGGYRKDSVSGALPNPFGTPTNTATLFQAPAFWLRASA